MNEHDIERHVGSVVVCACGREFPTVAAHEGHYQVERARRALRGEKEAPVEP